MRWDVTRMSRVPVRRVFLTLFGVAVLLLVMLVYHEETKTRCVSPHGCGVYKTIERTAMFPSTPSNSITSPLRKQHKLDAQLEHSPFEELKIELAQSKKDNKFIEQDEIYSLSNTETQLPSSLPEKRDELKPPLKLRKNVDTQANQQREFRKSSFPKRETTNVSLKCNSLLQEDGLVRQCVTGEVLGQLPSTVNRVPLRFESKGLFESTDERRKSFQHVYNTLAWGHNWDKGTRSFNASGRGASIYWTQEAMAVLHTVISQVKVQLGKSKLRVLDVPCGDMAWMSRFLQTRDDIDYTGIDIVPAVISRHRKKYKDRGWIFHDADIMEYQMNTTYDLIFCRTLLQHLYNNDVMKLLTKFSNSNSKYLLVTTFSRHEQNDELKPGDSNPGRFREINLEIPPISLTPPLCISRDGPPDDTINKWDHFLALWKLPLFQVQPCKMGWELKLKNTQYYIYSCVNWNKVT